MEDDCLVPYGQLIIKYKGPNPFRVVQRTPKFMRDIWEVEAVGYWERDFRYNPDEDPRGFLQKSVVEKGMDRFSKVVIEVIIQGKQPSDPNKEGVVEIKIGGILKTTFGGDTVFDDIRNPLIRQMYWFYEKFFHRKRRMQYLDDWCRQRLELLKRQYQELLKITPTGEKAIL